MRDHAICIPNQPHVPLSLFLPHQTQGDDLNVPGLVGQRVVRYVIQLQYEFGTAGSGYYDDVITVSVVAKRLLSSTQFADYDGVITGYGLLFFCWSDAAAARKGHGLLPPAPKPPYCGCAPCLPC